jgi:hypothetical protein
MSRAMRTEGLLLGRLLGIDLGNLRWGMKDEEPHGSFASLRMTDHLRNLRRGWVKERLSGSFAALRIV